ncbi:O-succinylhomoserine sulfhydrylase [Parvibium lacunae]|uniref:O-succinylhomoserine sulfhydrylase n=1 Tax=Parvibium lacunae TaxID=1888893 RepID=A0A368L400_9BURK|nr:O-succinylhomoserine sulfhydrylase [Parvibium lacunae]RCS58299.1 O-succinylhomoserine sulfhydrylase [Parvibium lacunae]
MHNDDFHLDTLAVRAGIERSQFGEHAEALYLTSSFVFKNAAEAAARFSGSAEGNVYSRFTNPTVTMFEQRLAALEGAEDCLATASGMSAILSCCMGVLSAGDHIVCSQSVFGSTINLFNTILNRFGITTTYVPLHDVAAWQAAVRPNTKLFYVETPSNPLMELADVPALSQVARAAGALLVVDNCFCTPVLQQPLAQGADVVIHSATKYLDGQGRVLGGAVVGSKEFIRGKILPFLRTAGPTLSAFNAWVILKGLETLSLRMERQCANALALAHWLEAHPKVARVYYPGLASHPQHALAQRQQRWGGAVVSFEVVGGRDEAWRVIDHTKLLSITANLGDTKTTITHPASTTHGRITPEARAAAGIQESLIRVAVGLEHITDIQADLSRGLD